MSLPRSRYLERPINPMKDLLALFEIRRFIKKNHIEIVHTHSSKAGILGRLAGCFSRVSKGFGVSDVAHDTDLLYRALVSQGGVSYVN